MMHSFWWGYVIGYWVALVIQVGVRKIARRR
jgi:hypothetical protein